MSDFGLRISDAANTAYTQNDWAAQIILDTTITASASFNMTAQAGSRKIWAVAFAMNITRERQNPTLSIIGSVVSVQYPSAYPYTGGVRVIIGVRDG